MSIDYPKVYLYRRIVQAKLFIDDNYSRPIDLHAIADEAFFSKFHFIRLFKNTYGMTPHQYLIHVRIEKAKLLLQDNIMINEVCFLVGFDSPSSCTGLFKRITKLTPSAYQQQQLQLKADIALAPLKYVPNCFASAKGWTKNSNFQEV